MAVESSEIQRGEYLPRVADGLLTQALQSSGAVQIKGGLSLFGVGGSVRW